MADDGKLLEVWQAEWCPFSRMVRERLTELDVDFVARQVAAYPDGRAELREATGLDTIPVVVFPDGEVLGGETEEIVAELDRRFPEPPSADEHRAQWHAHL